MTYNFIIFGLSPWNIDYGCNIKDISLELAKNHRVLYVDVPLKRKERWFKKKSRLVAEAHQRIASGMQLQRLQENLWHYIPDEMLESVNSFRNDNLFDFFNRINNKRFARAIKKVAAQIGFSDYILLNDNDIYNGVDLKRLLKPACTVYYLRDMLSAFEYWKHHVRRLEPLLIKEYDVVVTNSEYLAGYARAFNPESYYVGQGCDVNHYRERPSPELIDEAFRGIPRPIVGYVGALNSERLSIPLIEMLANKMPDHSFVLVGPEDSHFQHSGLHAMSNVYFPGKKAVAELPCYVYGFDVCINPQALNEITIGNYPRKIDEYLAAGKPVVATDTKAMQPFRDHVYLGVDADSYKKLIQQAIAENSEGKETARRTLAFGHTWKSNADAIIAALERVYHKK